MEIHNFSPKQLRLMTWWCRESPDQGFDAVICDGAVRSGKTLCMSLSFVLWATSQFMDASFAICGKTVTSLSTGIKMNPVESSNIEGIGYDNKNKHLWVAVKEIGRASCRERV